MILKKFVYSGLAGLFAALLATSVAAEESGSQKAMDHLLEVGYRGVSVNDNGGSAREYDELRSSPVVNLDFTGNFDHKHLYLEGDYKGVNDYQFVGHLDIGGAAVFDVSTERLWHNLDHIDYNRPAGVTSVYNHDYVTDPTGLVTPDISETRATFSDANPDADYGLRLQFDEARAKFKLGDYPGHVQVKYWRQTKQGKKQLRFAEEGHETGVHATPPSGATCNSCHVQSKTRDVKRVTDEFTASIDAHVCYLDLVFEQMVRFFTVKDAIPVDSYYGHSRFGPMDLTNLQHSEDPESRLIQSTVKARTSLTGGFVADAAYTYGQRQNRSDLAASTAGGVDGVEAETTYQKVAGNVSYTPVASLTFNLRYRMLDIDTKNADVLTTGDSFPSRPTTGPPVSYRVRDNLDVNRYQVAAAASWRPNKILTLKGDAQREVVTRGMTGAPTPFSSSTAPLPPVGTDSGINTRWNLPDQEVIDQFRVNLTARPLGNQALKLNTWYRYSHSSDPAYGTSYKDRHEGFAGLNYNSRAYWGATVAGRAQRDSNNEQTLADGTAGKRSREQLSGDLGFWMTPLANLTAGVNYGYLRSKIRQDVLLGALSTVIPTNNADYLMNSHTLSLYTVLQILDNLSLRADGYYLQSTAQFTPELLALTFPNGLIATSDDLSAISRLDICQQGISAGIDWEPLDQWRIGLTYAFDDYNARNSDIYDGTTQTLTGSLAYSW